MQNPSLDVTYLDHNASLRLPDGLAKGLGERAVELLRTTNPSSTHAEGRRAHKFLTSAESALLELLKTTDKTLYWTSGATEANAWALHSYAMHQRLKTKAPARILLSGGEHESLKSSARKLAEAGLATIEWVALNSDGLISVADLEQKLKTATALVAISAVNSETGVIQPLSEISSLCNKNRVTLHVDAVQAFGKVELLLDGVQSVSISAHKIGGPKGVGALLFSKAMPKPAPLIAGKQQLGVRGGTENTLGIGLFGEVLQEIANGKFQPFPTRLQELQKRFEAALKEKIPGVVVHGEGAPRVLNTSFIGFENLDSNSLVAALDGEGICASSGSACSSGAAEPSQTLLEMGLSRAMARSSLRFSSGPETTWRDFERILEILPRIVERARLAV